MSIPVLLELNEELKRLAVAGAAVAAGDFRVKRLIPAMQKLGAAASVFSRAAELMERLTAVEEPERPARLLELVSLVNAVLATQGRTAPEGEDFVPFLGCESEYASFLSCRKLMSLEDALTRGSSGRMDVLHQALQDGAFRDFRLIMPLLRALSDGGAGAGSFAVERLAEYGRDIVPFLKKDLDPQGGKPHARRVEAVSKAAGAGENDWYRSVAENGEGPVRAEAVWALRFSRANEDILLSYTFDRKKEVREAAFSALGFFDSGTAVKRLAEAFDGRDRGAAMEGISRCAADSLTEHLMRRAETALMSLVQSGKVREAERKKTGIPYDDREVSLLSDAFEALRYKRHPGLLRFYESLTQYAAHMTWLQAGADTNLGTVARQWAWNILYLGAACPDGSLDAFAGPRERFYLLDKLFGRFGNYYVAFCFAAAAVSDSPEEVFGCYSPVLRNKSGMDAGMLALREVFLDVLEYRIGVSVQHRYAPSVVAGIISAAKPIWDDRWLDLFIENDMGEQAARLARKGHKKCGEYLTRKLEDTLRHPQISGGPWVYVAGLLQMEHEKASKLALHALETRLAARDYAEKYDVGVLRLLPGECAGKISELAVQYRDEALADIAEQVKRNPEMEKKKRFGLL